MGPCTRFPGFSGKYKLIVNFWEIQIFSNIFKFFEIWRWANFLFTQLLMYRLMLYNRGYNTCRVVTAVQRRVSKNGVIYTGAPNAGSKNGGTETDRHNGGAKPGCKTGWKLEVQKRGCNNRGTKQGCRNWTVKPEYESTGHQLGCIYRIYFVVHSLIPRVICVKGCWRTILKLIAI